MRHYLRLIAALDRAGVDYVVVGGVAVLLRGVIRTTVDLDLALRLTTPNVTAALDVLTAHGLRPRLPVPMQQFADEPTRQQWVRERNLVAFTMVDPGDARTEVDLLATIPVAYEELSGAADRLDVLGVAVNVASVPHLIALKEHAGRTRDLADVEALRALRHEPGGTPGGLDG